MSKRKQETDYAAELENSFARWEELFTKGGSDPFWTDGVDLNLVRGHIIYYKQQLEKQENSLFGLPDIYYRETPSEVDYNYMTRPDEIRENAQNAMETINADENLHFIREQYPTLSEQQIKQWHITAVINYADNLRRAIHEDDLVIMRRYKDPTRFLESFEAAAKQIQMPESCQKINGSLTACDVENDDVEEEYEDEQCENEEIDLPEEKPQESFQLKLF